jgi:acyl-CoA thioester hydrolase
VNAPDRLDSTPRLEDYPYRLTDNVRFADLDPNQHVNNAVYATYFETGRVTLMKDPGYGLTPPGLAWIMVRLDIHFRTELRWPGTIEMGLGVGKFGRTSVTFDQVVFSEGKCVASARSVSVLIGGAGCAKVVGDLHRQTGFVRLGKTCIEPSGLTLRRGDHKAIQLVAHLDLAR